MLLEMLDGEMPCPERNYLVLQYMFKTGLREKTAQEHLNFLIKLGEGVEVQGKINHTRVCLSVNKKKLEVYYGEND